MPTARRHLQFVRLLLIAWVVCGLLVQPVMGVLGELHAIEHAAAVDADHGHHHDYATAGHDHHDLQIGPDGKAPDVPSPLHGLLHAYVGMSAADLHAPPALDCPSPVGGDPPLAGPECGRFASCPSSPFRPPIV